MEAIKNRKIKMMTERQKEISELIKDARKNALLIARTVRNMPYDYRCDCYYGETTGKFIASYRPKSNWVEASCLTFDDEATTKKKVLAVIDVTERTV